MRGLQNLEELKNEIEKYCEGKFDIFHCEATPREEGKTVIYQGTYHEFLKFAEKQGVKIIYMLTKTIEENDLENLFYMLKPIEEDDSGEQEYFGKIAFIEIGFFINGVYHALIEKADWFAIPEEVEEIEEGYPKEIEEKSKETLVEEMMAYIQKEYPEALENEEIIHQAQTSFWLEKGLEHKFHLEPQLRIKIDKIDDIARGKIIAKIKEKEKEMPPNLIKECVKWAREQGFLKLNKSNVVCV